MSEREPLEQGPWGQAAGRLHQAIADGATFEQVEEMAGHELVALLDNEQ